MSNKNIWEVHVNDIIVLVHNYKTPKSQWKIGKILELFKSKEGWICGIAIVLTKTTRNEHLIKRPLNRLCLLEYDKEDEDVKIRFVDDANIKTIKETYIMLN